MGGVVERATGRAVAIVGGVAVERARSEEIDIGPPSRRGHCEDDAGVETARRIADDVHFSLKRDGCAAQSPAVLDAKDDAVGGGDFGQGIDGAGCFLD